MEERLHALLVLIINGQCVRAGFAIEQHTCIGGHHALHFTNHNGVGLFLNGGIGLQAGGQDNVEREVQAGIARLVELNGHVVHRFEHPLVAGVFCTVPPQADGVAVGVALVGVITVVSVQIGIFRACISHVERPVVGGRAFTNLDNGGLVGRSDRGVAGACHVVACVEVAELVAAGLVAFEAPECAIVGATVGLARNDVARETAVGGLSHLKTAHRLQGTCIVDAVHLGGIESDRRQITVIVGAGHDVFVGVERGSGLKGVHGCGDERHALVRDARLAHIFTLIDVVRYFVGAFGHVGPAVDVEVEAVSSVGDRFDGKRGVDDVVTAASGRRTRLLIQESELAVGLQHHGRVAGADVGNLVAAVPVGSKGCGSGIVGIAFQTLVPDAHVGAAGAEGDGLQGEIHLLAVLVAYSGNDKDFAVRRVVLHGDATFLAFAGHDGAPRTFGLLDIGKGEDVIVAPAVLAAAQEDAAVGQFLAFRLVAAGSGTG